MIVVAGMPRSGTSLIMQTLHLLGMPLFGIRFPIRRDKANNPEGYWEHIDTMSGKLEELAGDPEICVKVHLRKLVEVADWSLIDKVILCTRDVETQATKQQETKTGRSSHARSKKQINTWHGKFGDVQTTNGVPTLTVDLADIRAQPAQHVNAIKAFVHAPLSTARAIANIR